MISAIVLWIFGMVFFWLLCQTKSEGEEKPRGLFLSREEASMYGLTDTHWQGQKIITAEDASRMNCPHHHFSEDRYIDMAYQWRTTTPESVMSTEEILEEALRILRSERASALQSNMEVAPNKVYGVDNATFQDRKNWE